ncbi:hypothetical protein GCM10007933_22970 [Zoogloea oryzae]|uniref:Uncharacterized protein n=1 Tax=Zoogloea oryzae TaxID=310767 RepID=A0ABQ6FC11_9RHOO|nr:hypothetical protein [Zoogloea oryzae]GLT22836.1 hypothetical protein GCM10007933_22970 [Zoogloea oryzae]
MTHAVIDGVPHAITVEFDDRRSGWWFRMPSLGFEFMAWGTSDGDHFDDPNAPQFLEADVACAAAGCEARISIRLGSSGAITEDLFASAALKALRAAFPEVFAGFAGTVELPRAE